MTRAETEANQRLDELIALTDRLTSLARREAEIMQARAPRNLAPLVEEKSELSANYARLTTALRRNQDLWKAASPAMKKRLKESTRVFRETLDDLAGRLTRIRHISEGLIRTIAADVADRRAAPVGYANDASPAARGAQPTPYLTLNRVV